ncbi:MAG: hypothetical protein V2I66_00815 [Halieaceae bacterium]|jgi:hypothetical protein|nr:hypothetical protein [Halieaceae bacterium]
MELLDAAIALVVTLAALATSVTVLMEIWIRIFGLKSQTQVELFQRIFDNAVAGKFSGNPEKNDFLSKVLLNPLFRDRKSASIPEPKPGAWAPFWGRKSQGIYEWVSDEHVYRQLLKMPGVAADSKGALVAKLKTFSRRYNELCAAASVEFKENRRVWSIRGGILLAFIFNVDAVRIYNEYLKRPELAASIAARADQLEQTAVDVQRRLDDVRDGKNKDKEDINAIKARIDELQGSMAELETSGVALGWRFPPHCLFFENSGAQSIETSGQPAPKANEQKPEESKTDGEEPSTSGAGKAGQSCSVPVPAKTGLAFWLGSFASILATGILIGLGAPFWFDVARRLAQVRNFLGNRGGTDTAYNGETAGAGDQNKSKSQKNKDLINRVVTEVLDEQSASGKRRLLEDRRED